MIKPHRVICVFVMTAALGFLNGCASSDEGPYDFSQGWRKASVLEISSGQDVRNPNFWRCLRQSTPSERLAGRYAVVSYHSIRSSTKHLVPVPNGLVLRPGDEVFVNIDRCDNALARRFP